MDLLEQYKEQHPEAFRPKAKWQPSQEYGFSIRLVMRLSGGRIREVRQASYVLVVAVAVVIIISLVIVWPRSGQRSFRPDEDPTRRTPIVSPFGP